MSSINKKDLRLLRPGELVMAKKAIAMFYPNGADEQSLNDWLSVIVGQGDIMLVIEDYRKINLAPKAFPVEGKILKVLYGDKILWLNKANHEMLSTWIMPVDAGSYVAKIK